MVDNWGLETWIYMCALLKMPKSGFSTYSDNMGCKF